VITNSLLFEPNLPIAGGFKGSVFADNFGDGHIAATFHEALEKADQYLEK
jgi:hypothetical protein